MEHSLVLLGRFPGKDRAVATALSRDFGRDDTWGMQVVGAAPIILLDGLTSDQAAAVHAALSDVEAAGCRFEIQPGIDPGLPKLSWPTPPRIKGRVITEIGAATQGATATLIVPCPYTGQKLKLTITVSLAKEGGLNIGAAAAQAVALPAPMPLPSAGPRPTPMAVPAPVAVGQAAAVRSVPAPAPIPQARPAAPGAQRLTPGAGQPIVVGLDSLDELTPMEAEPVAAARAVAPARAVAAPAMASPRSIPIPAPAARQAPIPAPLPDIPVIHNSPAAPAPLADYGHSNAAPMPVDLLSTPMDLATFEAGVSASGIMRAVQAEQPDAVEAAPNEEEGLCSVTIGKSANPKVHQTVAELIGISSHEAARLCQKPIVTLAKDISAADAREIKQRLSAFNVVAKITKRKA